ncbi:RpiB/LacA/LacB family sugar-phosphate isomerase [Kitasatospora sp. LaBMicrA B282]|uniref:RpiB/LacA/LacB family sugar-phosphate isomerase n=1 Tax=Kitasatospora sp. LaBMicrA B282 TaxID=3420949 RepID=UPI003D0E8BE2
MTRIVVGSDAATSVTTAVVDHLRATGAEVRVLGPTAGRPMGWVEVATGVAETVVGGGADLGVLSCYTGTGVSIAANKVTGARAALCVDAETARGARRWNDANILVLSYRLTSDTVAREITDAFLATSADPAEQPELDALAAYEAGRQGTGR